MQRGRSITVPERMGRMEQGYLRGALRRFTQALHIDPNPQIPSPGDQNVLGCNDSDFGLFHLDELLCGCRYQSYAGLRFSVKIPLTVRSAEQSLRHS